MKSQNTGIPIGFAGEKTDNSAHERSTALTNDQRTPSTFASFSRSFSRAEVAGRLT